jgi:hypothetical protein
MSVLAATCPMTFMVDMVGSADQGRAQGVAANHAQPIVWFKKSKEWTVDA